MLGRFLVFDAQPQFVQHCRPTQHGTAILFAQVPVTLHLGKGIQYHVAHPLGLGTIQLVTADQAVGSAFAGIAAPPAPYHAVDEPLAQRTAGQA